MDPIVSLHNAGKWEFRAIEALRANQSLPGMILVAALSRSQASDGRPRKPSVGHKAYITADGNVIAKYVNPDGIYQGWQIVCKIGEMIDAFKRLADNLKLSDADRAAMFEKLRQWITHDYRDKSKLEYEPITGARPS